MERENKELKDKHQKGKGDIDKTKADHHELGRKNKEFEDAIN